MDINRRITITDTFGVEWDLNAGPIHALPDTVIWGTAPTRLGTRDRVNIAGSTLIGRRHTTREMVIPVILTGDTPAELNTTLRNFVAGTDGLITVTVETDGGVEAGGRSRQIDAYITEGLDALTMQWDHSTEIQTALGLSALHPYWRDTVPTVIEIDPPPTVWESGVATSYDDPISYDAAIPYNGTQIGEIGYDDPISYDDPIPYDGAGASVIITEFTNPGDVTAWPLWTVRGYTSRVSAANLTTQGSWRRSTALSAAQTMIVQTRPGAATVRIDGTLALGSLDDGADLWGLPPKVPQLVALEIAERGASASFVVSWTPEWLTC